MTTRTIVTSQPDVACDVCARRLLRGEQPDVFVAAGRRLTVCELCAPRATHEGWKRETDQPDLTLPPLRPRRGRGLLHRLRGMGAASDGQAGAADAVDAPAPVEPDHSRPFDMLASNGDGPAAGGEHEAVFAAPAVAGPAAPPYLQEALEVFNAGEYPRRVAGVARSLGAPTVHVRSAEHLASVVEIVVAWELCWYRYGVDLSVEPPVAEANGQGTELDELDREQRDGNALADRSGMLALAPQ